MNSMEVRVPGFTADIVLTKHSNYYSSIDNIESVTASTSLVQPARQASCTSGDGKSTCVCAGACEASKEGCSCL